MGKKISWKNVNFGDIEHLEILSSGIIEFKGEKDYLSTKSIQADKIKKAESKITYQKRPSRANMQPKINSVWFARMQGSFKVYCFNETNPDEINKYIFSTGFSGIKVNVERLLPKYVYYYLYSPNFNISKDRYSTGTTQVAITNSNIERISISFPKSKEQQQLIVREIEKQITRLDTAVESLKATNKKLDVYRKSVLDAAFDGDLTDTPSRGVDKISNLVECFRYGTSKKCDLDQTKTPVLRIPNIVGGLIDASELKYCQFSDDEFNKLKLNEGDILVIRSNGSRALVGRSAIVTKEFNNYCYAGYLIRLRLRKESITSKFFNYALQSGYIRLQIEKKAKSTSGVNNINAKELGSMAINMFSIEEQEQIVQEIESRFSVIDKLEGTVDNALKKSEQLRNSILKSAFEGKLVSYEGDT